MKLYLSADMEGTAGVTVWDETESDKRDYPHFQQQMTLEVAAACRGAIDGGTSEMLVKDAHGAGRNIDPSQLPECVNILRGSAKHPFIMMAGLDSSFDAVLYTGYHAAAGTNGNPLAHTMNGSILKVLINGIQTSELIMNSYTAAYCGVPVIFASGDEMLCAQAKTLNQNIVTVPVTRGIGSATISLHPHVAVNKIREGAKKAAEAFAKDKDSFKFELPKHFDVEVTYRDHPKATMAAIYPGATQTGVRTVTFACDDYMDVLRFFFFVL